ncbi:ATP-binding protein [Streptomyces populi]
MPASRAPRREPSSSPAHGDRAPGHETRAPGQGARPADDRALRPLSVPAGTAVSGDTPASTVRGAHGLRTTVPAHPSRVPGVRATVAEYLTRLRLPAERVEDAVLAAGELFTNALRHGSPDRGDTITVGIECGPRELRVSVADRSSALPVARTAVGAEESGRGLAIVAALSDEWGVAPADPGTEGKKVWFSMVLRKVP